MTISRRHKRLGLKTRVAKRIAEIPSDDWNKVLPNVLESYIFFKTMQNALNKKTKGMVLFNLALEEK